MVANEIPLPGVGKKGITIMGRHVSNDALLMTVGGLVAAVVLYKVGAPSTALNPNTTADQLYQPYQPPASVEGTTTDPGSVTGSGTPGPADPGGSAIITGGAPTPASATSGPLSVTSGAGGAAVPVIGRPPVGPSGGPSGISQMWTAARSLAAPIGPSQQSVRALAATGAGQSEAVQIAKAQQYNPPSGISQMWAAARSLASPESPVTPAWTQYRRPPVSLAPPRPPVWVGVAAPKSLNLGAGAQNVKPASARRY